MPLRPYQEECIRAVESSLAEYAKTPEHGSALVCLPTGSGKTVIFSEICKRRAGRGQRLLVAAQGVQLINQTAASIRNWTNGDLKVEVEMASNRAAIDSDVVVASIHSMKNERLRAYCEQHFDLIIVDEAHHAVSNLYAELIQHFDAPLVGFTATPNRADKRSLGDVFNNIAYEKSLLEMVREGWLADIVVKSVPIMADFSGVNLIGKDLDPAQSGAIVARLFDDVIKTLNQHASDRKTLVYWPLIQTSKGFTEAANASGLPTAHIDGETSKEDREKILEDLKNGRIKVVSNISVLTEGIDIPPADCILMMRPTSSQGLYTQAVGRGTRLHDTKKNCLILDPHFLHESLNLMEPARLIAEDEEQFSHIKASLGADGRLEDAADKAREEIEKKMVERLAQRARKHPTTRTLIQMSELYRSPAIMEFKPTSRWHEDPVTDAQSSALIKMGIKDISLIASKGHASAILDAAAKRRDKGLATFKQVALLKRWGVKNTEQMPYVEASAIISRRLGR